jgi:SHS2 domain-containing protein
MPYEFLPELATSDIAFRASGSSLEEVFRSASDAVMNAMIENLDSIQPLMVRRIDLVKDTLEMLLFDFLQEVIYYKDSEQLLLRIKEVHIAEGHGEYKLRAEAAGEILDPARHQQRVDVKAVTFHQFALQRSNSGWEAIVVLDI